MQKMSQQDSQYQVNCNELAELERQERLMVEKLNQTRMSAMSAQSSQPRNPSLSASKMSPFKPAPNRNFTSTKKGPKNPLNDEDFNDRVEFDKSIKVVPGGPSASAQKPSALS